MTVKDKDKELRENLKLSVEFILKNGAIEYLLSIPEIKTLIEREAHNARLEREVSANEDKKNNTIKIALARKEAFEAAKQIEKQKRKTLMLLNLPAEMALKTAEQVNTSYLLSSQAEIKRLEDARAAKTAAREHEQNVWREWVYWGRKGSSTDRTPEQWEKIWEDAWEERERTVRECEVAFASLRAKQAEIKLVKLPTKPTRLGRPVRDEDES